MALTGVSTSVVDMSGDTTGLVIAKGTTAERNAISSPQAGMIRNNTETDRVEVYNGTDWRNLVEAGNTSTPFSLEYLVVGGGGAAYARDIGMFYVGGAGAGGYRTNFQGTALTPTLPVTYTITVGQGGTSVITTYPSQGTYTDGGSSTITDSASFNITANGGAKGPNAAPGPPATQNGTSGGSGSGGAGQGGVTAGGGGNIGGFTPPEGNSGGIGGGTDGGGGGGGGSSSSGAYGASISASVPNGYGGPGTLNTITGTNVYYGVGGSGGSSAYNAGGSNYNTATPPETNYDLTNSAALGTGNGGTVPPIYAYPNNSYQNFSSTYIGFAHGKSGSVVLRFPTGSATFSSSNSTNCSTADFTNGGYTVKKFTCVNSLSAGTITVTLS
jgi:hypothetical protein